MIWLTPCQSSQLLNKWRFLATCNANCLGFCAMALSVNSCDAQCRHLCKDIQHPESKSKWDSAEKYKIFEKFKSRLHREVCGLKSTVIIPPFGDCVPWCVRAKHWNLMFSDESREFLISKNFGPAWMNCWTNFCYKYIYFAFQVCNFKIESWNVFVISDVQFLWPAPV